MPIKYDPKTDEGIGFLPPLLKAANHVRTVTIALGYEWPITVEVARSEIDDAIKHGNLLAQADNVLSKDAVKAVNDWRKQISDMSGVLNALEAQKPDKILNKKDHDAVRTSLKTIEQQTWALMSILDVDLLGWQPEETDAGRKP